MYSVIERSVSIRRSQSRTSTSIARKRCAATQPAKIARLANGLIMNMKRATWHAVLAPSCVPVLILPPPSLLMRVNIRSTAKTTRSCTLPHTSMTANVG